MAAPDTPVLQWETHAPWLVQLTTGEVASWGIKDREGKPWQVGRHGDAPRSVTAWLALYIADMSAHETSHAETWVSVWRSEVDQAISAGVRTLPDFMTWWLLRASQDRLTSAAVDTIRTFTAEVCETPGFKRGEQLLESLARHNDLPLSAANELALSDASTQCLERDGPALWRCWLNGIIPAYQVPILTFWCPDPLTARWCLASSKKDEVSVLVTSRPPLPGALTVAMLRPRALSALAHARQQVADLLRLD